MSTLGRFARVRWLAPLALIAAGTTVACSAQPDDAGAGESNVEALTAYDPVNDLDVSLGENLWPNEQNDIKATSEIIQTFIKRRAKEARADVDGKKGRFLRDAHAKRHGCVKGELSVRGDIPDDLKVGVFQKARIFKTWQRYSNGNSEIRSDWKTDARGMAIKLTNVEGRKLVPEYPEQSTQDFVMINHPVFFVDNPVKYAQTLAIFHSGLGFGLEAVGQALSLSKLCSKDEPGGGILPLCDTAKLALARVWIAVDPSGCEASSRGLRRRTATRVGQCGADERGRMTRRALAHVRRRRAPRARDQGTRSTRC